MSVYVLASIISAMLSWILRRKYKDISEDIILITGGGSGIGRQIAINIAQHRPKHIILWGRHEESLRMTTREISELHVQASYMVCDVGCKEQVYEQANLILKTIGHVTILINNAGVVFSGSLLKSKDEDIIKTFNTNTMAQFWTVRTFLPHMVKTNRGHIVSMNSMLGLMGLNGAISYCSSKYAVTAFTDSLRDELKNTDVRVTSIHPYQVDNGMFAGCKTRFPSLFLLLEENYVGACTTWSILTNRQIVLLPRIMYLTNMLKSLLPITAMHAIHRFTGTDKTMETHKVKNERHCDILNFAN